MNPLRAESLRGFRYQMLHSIALQSIGPTEPWRAQLRRGTPATFPFPPELPPLSSNLAENGLPISPLQLAHPDGIAFVDFQWMQDRFVHSVRIESFETKTLAENESTPWPQSPPMQQLSIEMIDGRNVALGVGCAGKSHWSLSVEPVENGFRFDWACKTKADAGETSNQLRNGSGG